MLVRQTDVMNGRAEGDPSDVSEEDYKEFKDRKHFSKQTYWKP
jgi:hypothetical protein